VLGVFSICIFPLVPEAAAVGRGQSTFHELMVDGIRRSYIVYQPLTSGTKSLPLMIVLHGGLGNAAHIQKTTGMDAVADTGPFVVAYPNGIGGNLGFNQNRRTWNAGDCCGKAVRNMVDDVRFIEKVIEDIAAKLSIDARRVYVTGMSNGAMMAYRLACEIPDKIAAIIPVAGTIAVENCNAAKDIPVLHIHGMEDKNVPISGGEGDLSIAGIDHTSLSETVKRIVGPRHCLAPEKSRLNGGVQVSAYRCSNGAPVFIYLIKSGGHEWPGGNGGRSGDSVGSNFSASQQAWDFAKQFAKKF
jgi:polyhydroxybutyrate depolymerase